jgi:L-alanine-DL-glutamate epimerase-like enolase superfamily enzyme
MGRAFDDLGVTWFEEPVSSDDLAGLRQVRSQITADVAAGEYAWSLVEAQRLCAAQAVDCLQADATRCGGYTEWIRIAAVAAAHNLQISAHCAPALHAPVAAAVTNLRHVEWFHDHVRIEHLLLDGAPDAKGGVMTPDLTTPGHGISLSASAAQYRTG